MHEEIYALKQGDLKVIEYLTCDMEQLVLHFVGRLKPDLIFTADI